MKENIPVSYTFEISSRAAARQLREQKCMETHAFGLEQSLRYEDYLRTEPDRHISGTVGTEQFATMVRASLQACKNISECSASGVDRDCGIVRAAGTS